MTTEMCEEAVNINLMGAIRVTKHFLPLISEVPGKFLVVFLLINKTFVKTKDYNNHTQQMFRLIAIISAV